MIYMALAITAGILLGCSFFQNLAGRVLEQPTATSSPTQPIVATTPSQGEFSAIEQHEAMLASESAALDPLGEIPAYELFINIDYPERRFEGRSSLDLTNLEIEPLDSIYFRLMPNGGKSYGPGRLEITSALLDGEPVQVASADPSIVQLVLNEPLAVGGKARIQFEFEGEVPLEFGEGSSGGYGIFNYSEGVMALSGWFPILAVYDQDGWNLDPVSAIGDSVYSDAAFFDVVISAPADLTVIATGVEAERQTIEDQTLRHYVSGPARDFFIILSPDYERTSRELDGTRVNSYTLPGHADSSQQALEIALDSLRVFNESFGPYPFVELDIVEAPMRGALGVEFPGIVLVASQLYDERGDSFVIATAHEVAHQWWYNVVGNDVFDEPWLDEALATYSSAVYFQAVYGENSYRGFAEYWQSRYDQLVERGADEPVTRSLDYFESLDNSSVYAGVVYTKGALFLKTIREQIGDEAFFQALNDYYADNHYQIATASDLLDAFKAASGRDLSQVYQKWLYSPGK